MAGRVSVPGVPHKLQGETKSEVMSRCGTVLTKSTAPCYNALWRTQKNPTAMNIYGVMGLDVVTIGDFKFV